jgi:predicted RNA binding protein YcfA (HicA-like mRNA interferase family)
MKLPVLPASEVIRVLEKEGFQIIRQRGSQVRLKQADGRTVTVPVHSRRDVGRGLLRKILRDADLSREKFVALLDQ